MGSRILKALNIKGNFRTAVVPMINYNLTNIYMGGAAYIISVYFTIFLTDVVNLSLKQAGIIVMVSTVWDAITDPVMGVVTDRTRSKRGKHRPYLLIGIPIMMLSYSLMWNSYGFGTNTTITTLYYIFAYMLYKTAYTIIGVPHTAMLPELAPEYNLRTQYVSVGNIFNSVGLFPAYAIILTCLSVFGSSGKLSSASKTPFLIAGIFQSIFFGAAVFLTYKFVKERPSDKDKVEKLDVKYIFREYALVFKNKPFRQYFFMTVAHQFAIGFFANSKVYYIKYLANQYSHYTVYNMLDVVGSTAAFPINYALAMKYGKRRCGDIITPFMFIGLAVGLFMQPSKPGTSSAIFWVILMAVAVVLYQFGQSGLGYVSANIFPDLTDVDELITGRRREGVIATFSTFIKKSISGVMAAFVAFILQDFGLVTGDKVAEYEKLTGELYQQTAGAMWGVRLCVALVPMIAGIVAFLLLRRFEMTRDDHALIRAAVATKHKYGSVTLTPEQRDRLVVVSGQKWEDTWLGQHNNEAEGHTLDLNEDGEYIILIEKELEDKKKMEEVK